LSAALWAAAAPPLVPQQAGPAPQPEIHGMVLEPGTNQPVPDAVVSFYYLGEEQPKIMVGTGLLQVTGTVNTDATGAFSAMLFKLGYYRVAVKKNAYVQNPNSTTSVTLTADAPSKEVRLSLMAPGHITGWVVDEETGKPIEGVRVAAAQAMNRVGMTVYGGTGASNGPITDAEGRFESRDLTPGKYMAAIGEQTTLQDRVLTEFSEKDLKTVDLDFETTYWPGGRGQDSAMPVTVDSGATVSVGKLSVKKVPHYRVHVRIPPSTCGPEDTMEVYEQPPLGGVLSASMLTIANEVRCRGDLLITGFTPGSYRLILAVNKRSAEDREMASVPFAIADENIEITASLERGVRLEGKFIAADGAAPPDYSKLSFRLSPLGMLPFAGIASPVKADANGKFSLAGVPVLNAEVSVMGTGTGNYVKEIRYNGIPIRDNLLPLERGAPAQELTVVIDDKPAAIAGSVTDGEKPVGKAFVILAKWPLTERPEGRPYLPTATATADDQGNFQFAGLAPGEYRVIALRTGEEFDARAAGALESTLGEADKVEAGPSALRNVNIRVGALR
jgi:5-hydroxyisourate hydrolase-like protein (transthyretin family)